jgi:hypothetical protein
MTAMFRRSLAPSGSTTTILPSLEHRCLVPGAAVAASCQGDVPAFTATALLAAADDAAAQRALAFVGAPINPLAGPTRVVTLICSCSREAFTAESSWPVPPSEAGKGRLVYPSEAQLAALMRCRIGGHGCRHGGAPWFAVAGTSAQDNGSQGPHRARRVRRTLREVSEERHHRRRGDR